MSDGTTYTVVDTLDNKVGAGIGSFYEKNAIPTNQPAASTDDTTYATVDDVSASGMVGSGSFYKRNPNV